jgi:hypothetical protein
VREPTDSWDQLHASGLVADALRYADLFWPSFVERNGMVFLVEEAEVQPDLRDPEETLKRFGGDKSEMERRFNLIEVAMLFADGVEADDDALDQVAAMLRDMWQAKLHRDFPGREFVVEILEGELDDPTLRFYELRR